MHRRDKNLDSFGDHFDIGGQIGAGVTVDLAVEGNGGDGFDANTSGLGIDDVFAFGVAFENGFDQMPNQLSLVGAFEDADIEQAVAVVGVFEDAQADGIAADVPTKTIPRPQKISLPSASTRIGGKGNCQNVHRWARSSPGG